MPMAPKGRNLISQALKLETQSKDFTNNFTFRAEESLPLRGLVAVCSTSKARLSFVYVLLSLSKSELVLEIMLGVLNKTCLGYV
jgi:hypothetical protein